MTSPEGEFARSLWKHLELPENEIQRLHLSPDPDLAFKSSFELGAAAQVG